MIDSPRLRLLVGTHGLRLAAALAVVAALAILSAGWLAFTPPTETVTQQAHQQEVVTATGTSAVVTSSGSLWPEGTELRDKPVYLYNATPSMTVSAQTEVQGAQRATIHHEWRLTLRAVSDGEVFWSETETLATRTREGPSARTNATIDVAALRERVRTQQQRVGDAGTVEAVLELTVEYETGRYEGSRTLSTPIRFRENGYGLAKDLADRTSRSTPVTAEVTRPPNRALAFGLGGFGVLALAGAAGIVRQRPDTIDLEAARNEVYRRQYAEWISPGTIPDGLDQAFLALESLEDVVDVAIDTNERVIHDTRRDLYAVISGDVVYYYSAEGNWEDTMFPSFDFPESEEVGQPQGTLAPDGEGSSPGPGGNEGSDPGDGQGDRGDAGDSWYDGDD